MELSREELRHLAATVGSRQGWDFSRVRAERDPVPWDYAEVVRRYLRPTDRVLDIGTGGGEVFLSLAPSFLEGVGVDHAAEMVQTAVENARATGVSNVSFMVMAAQDLRSAEASFDVVLDRHSGVFVDQIVRVLRPGGYFITQQVAGRNAQSIYSAFGWGSTGEYWRRYWDEHCFAHQDARSLAEQLSRADCSVEVIAEYDVPYYFLDVESLIFWLKGVPLPEDFDAERHWEAVNRLLAASATNRGIATNEHRELLVARRAARGGWQCPSTSTTNSVRSTGS